MSRTLIILFLVLAGAALAFPPVTQRVTVETPLAQVSPPTRGNWPTRYFVSSDGSALVWAAPSGANTQAAFRNGAPGKAYDRLTSRFAFTHDGRPIYTAMLKGKTYLVIGTCEYGPYDGVRRLENYQHGAVDQISADDAGDDPNAVIPNFLTITVRTGIWNGTGGSEYEPTVTPAPSGVPSSLPLVLSAPQGGRLAWVVADGGRQRVVIDGQAGPAYTRICALACSADGRHVAYGARDGARWVVVKDGVENPAVANRQLSAIHHFFYTPDSRHLSYRETVTGNERYVLDGRLVPAGVLAARFPAAPKSSHVEDLRYQCRYQCVVTIIPTITQITPQPFDPATLSFSPPPPKYENCKQLVLHRADESEWAFSATVGGKEAVVVGDKEGKHYQHILWLNATPDERHFYYVAGDGNRVRLVRETGRAGRAYDNIEAITFSPDGKHLAYRGLRGNAAVVVLDEQQSRAYDTVTGPWFDPRDALVSFQARRGLQWTTVINDWDGPVYDELLSAPFSDGANRLHYFARRGRSIYRVDEQVATAPR